METPPTLKLATGSHVTALKVAGLPDYSRTVDVLKSSKLTLKAAFAAKADP